MTAGEVEVGAPQEILVADRSRPTVRITDPTRTRPGRRRVAAVTASVAVLTTAFAVLGYVTAGHRPGPAPVTTSTTPPDHRPAQPSARQPVTVVDTADLGVYGVGLNLLYRSARHEHVLAATLLADGIVGRTEIYKVGSDTSGYPQQPVLAPGSLAAIAVYAVPDCTAGATLGRSPILVVTTSAADGASTLRTFPVAVAGTLSRLASHWCGHGVMTRLETAAGAPGCEVKSATLLVRNSFLSPATLSIDGHPYRAPALTVPAGGVATWTITSAGPCPSRPGRTAIVRYGDGRAGTVGLGLDTP